MSSNLIQSNQEVFQAAMVIIDTTPATSTSASLMLAGGLTIFSTQSATNFNSGGALLNLGGSSLIGNVIIGGITQILNTILSTNTSTGALIVVGGLAVQGNAYCNYGNFNSLQATSNATIPNLISTNISANSLSVSTFNPVNITCQNLYTTNSLTAANLIVNNFSTNSLYINSTASGNIPTIFGYNSNNTTATGIAFSSWNGTSFIEKARFDSIGNFLINTTQPNNSNTLYLNCLSNSGSDGGIFDTQYAISPIIGFSVQGSRKYTLGIDTADAYKFKFNRGLFNSQVNSMTIDQNGNVGIGTVSPSSTLQVVGDTNISGNLTSGTFFTSIATIGNLNLTNFTTNTALFTSTNVSTNTSSGAVIINGGLGIGGNINIGGNAIVNGNLTINGTTITVNSTNVSIEDNILQLNYIPTGPADSGLQMSRYQIANNVGSGDIVNDSVAFAGSIQTGSTNLNIIINSSQTTNGYYIGYWIKIISGTLINQVRQIIAYNGSTKTITLQTSLTTAPTAGDLINLYGNVYAINIFNQATNSFQLGFANSTTAAAVNFVTAANLILGNLTSNLITSNNIQVTNSTITNLNLSKLLISNLTVSNLFAINNTCTNLIATNQSISNQNITNSIVTNETINNLNTTLATLGNTVNTNITISNSLNVIGTSNLTGLLQSINETSTNATISNIINTNITGTNLIYTNISANNIISANASINGTFVSNIANITNLTGITATIPNLVSTNITVSNLNTTNIVSANNSCSNIISTNINSINYTGTNCILTNISNSNLLTLNAFINNFTASSAILTTSTTNISFINNATATNLFISNNTINNLNVTNATSSNILTNNLIFTNCTSSNFLTTNITSNSIFTSNGNFINSTFANSVVTNSTFTNLLSTNISVNTLLTANLNTTNFTTVNSIITNQTIGTINATNINVTNVSAPSIAVMNFISTNSSFTNLISTNTTMSTLNTNSITTNNLLVTGTSQNTIYIDSLGSQTNYAQIIFKNTSGVGDFKITSDGGDIQWQGGGSRALQMGAYHEIRLLGGRFTTSAIPFINGFNATYNTIIQNTNNSIALYILATAGQTVPLTQWVNSSNTKDGTSTGVMAQMDANANLSLYSTADAVTAFTGGALTITGGISIGKSAWIGSNNISTNNSTGALVVSGGGGFNGSVYSNNNYVYQGTSIATLLTPSPLLTKGDIYTYATSGNRLAAGSYGQVLISNTSANTSLQWVSPLTAPGAYGSEYNYVASLNTSGSTSTIGSLKTSLTSGTLVGGIYKIEINYDITANTSIAANCEIAVYINTNSINGFNVGVTTSNLLYYNIYRATQTATQTPFCTTLVQTFGNSIQTIGLYYRSQITGQTINIGNASILLYRIQ